MPLASSTRNDSESAVCPGGGHHRDPQAGGVDDFTIAQRSAEPAQEPAAHRADDRTGPVDDLVDAAGVVFMLVTDQHQRNGAERGEPVDVLVVVGPGSTITISALPGPRNTHVLVPSSVMIPPGLLHRSTEAVSVTGRRIPYAGWVIPPRR